MSRHFCPDTMQARMPRSCTGRSRFPSDVAGFTNSIKGGKAQYTFPYPFPSNIAQPGTQDFDLSYELHYKDPYVQQWNFTFERDLGFQTGLRLSYDGSHGSDLSVTTNPDQVPANTIGFTMASASAPYPIWDSLVNVENSARSNYQSFTATIFIIPDWTTAMCRSRETIA